MKLLAIDPGPVFSAYCIIDTVDYFCLKCAKVKNTLLYNEINHMNFDDAVIEGISSYGARVGESVFSTCYVIGFLFCVIGDMLGKYFEQMPDYMKEHTIKRREVKQILGLASGTTDAGVRHYLVERFADGEPNYGKGRRGAPGWFYGFKDDIWQAYALGVAYIDNGNF